MTPDLWVHLALGAVAVLAGFVDAIAGGGGLIAVPALLAAGLPPVAALATNKAQSVVGTFTAALTYWRAGFVDMRRLLVPVAVTFAGSFLGALTVRSVDTSALEVAVPILLIAVAGYFLVAPKLTDADRAARLGFLVFAPVMGLAIGYYDGIFGPGTGSFFTIGFVTLFGLGITRAAASTKVLNVSSNVGALALFVPAGEVLWTLALVMAAGQLIGAYVGARIGIRFGARLIKPMVAVISVAMAIKLLFWP